MNKDEQILKQLLYNYMKKNYKYRNFNLEVYNYFYNYKNGFNGTVTDDKPCKMDLIQLCSRFILTGVNYIDFENKDKDFNNIYNFVQNYIKNKWHTTFEGYPCCGSNLEIRGYGKEVLIYLVDEAYSYFIN